MRPWSRRPSLTRPGCGDVVTGLLTDVRKVFAHENKENVIAASVAQDSGDF